MAIALLLGAVFGSFVSMASYRLPRDLSLFGRHSQCPHCHHNLSFKDLIPIISWLFSKGTCRYCHRSISWRYPLTEFGMGLAFLLVYIQFGISYETALLWLITIVLTIMLITDLEHYLLPDSTQLALLCLAIAYTFSTKSDFPAPLIGGCSGLFIGLFLRKLGFWMKKCEAFGWGDVKFLAIAGVFLGTNLELITVFLLTSGLFGIILALIWQAIGKGKRFPFGPALIIALWLCIIYPFLTDILFHSLYSFLNLRSA